MAFLHERINPSNGAIYVYDCESKRDPVTGIPKTKQTYMGKRDKITGEITPPKMRKPRKKTQIKKINTDNNNESSNDSLNHDSNDLLEANNNLMPIDNENNLYMKTLIYGPYYLLNRITETLNLKNILKKYFPDDYQIIMSLSYYVAQKGQPLYRIEGWSNTHIHPYGFFIGAPRVSELLKTISEDQIQSFLGAWLKQISEKEHLFFDITSISSYSKSNEYVRYGYNRDDEKLEQINLALLLGQESRLPCYFRTLPGNINDVSTLKTTVNHLNLMGVKKLSYILDKGFFSNDNIEGLIKNRSNFLISVPKNRIWLEKILNNYLESITQPENYYKVSDDESIFAIKHTFKWQNTDKRLYLYIFYNNNKKGEDYNDFIGHLLTLKEQILANKTDQKLYENFSRYIIIKNTPKRGLTIKFNHNEIKTYENKYTGFNCYLSTINRPCLDILQLYRDKDKVEKGFDDVKNTLDAKRLRIHDSISMNPRILIQFLALIYISYIRKITKSDKNLRNISTKELFDRLETLTQIKAKGRYGTLFTEIDKKADSILSLFNICWPPR